MPSHSSSVRLAPVAPMPRSETPCVVGFATRLDERRNKVKPGTLRRRSSIFTPGISSRSWRSITETTAGTSVEMVPVTVIDVLTGSIFGGGCGGSHCGKAVGVAIRTKHANRAFLQLPAVLFETCRSGAEDNLERVSI